MRKESVRYLVLETHHETKVVSGSRIKRIAAPIVNSFKDLISAEASYNDKLKGRNSILEQSCNHRDMYTKLELVEQVYGINNELICSTLLRKNYFV